MVLQADKVAGRVKMSASSSEGSSADQPDRIHVRKEAKRQHALKVRQSNKAQITELQYTVETLRDENAQLEQENAFLSARYQMLLQQNQVLMNSMLNNARAFVWNQITTQPLVFIPSSHQNQHPPVPFAPLAFMGINRVVKDQTNFESSSAYPDPSIVSFRATSTNLNQQAHHFHSARPWTTI